MKILITDLDNTLWDWFNIWYNSFRPMLDELVTVTGLNPIMLVNEIRTVHQKHHTAEYSFVLQELPSLQALYGSDFGPIEQLPTVVEACREGRKKTMSLYPGVFDTLIYLKNKGWIIIGFTESQMYYSMQRIRKLGLDGVLDQLYAGGNHEIPDNIDLNNIRQKPDSDFELKHTTLKHLPFRLKKPHKEILLRILADQKVSEPYHEVYFVGDSLIKDVSMAKMIPITAIHAKYGVSQNDSKYNLLRAVTHWTEEDVENERKIAKNAGDIQADFILENNFGEIIDYLCKEE